MVRLRQHLDPEALAGMDLLDLAPIDPPIAGRDPADPDIGQFIMGDGPFIPIAKVKN
jgi:hypothetical protein